MSIIKESRYSPFCIYFFDHRLSKLLFVVAIVSTNSFADIITYTAASNVLPSDSSIPANNRFQEVGSEYGYSTISNGILNIHDTSTVNETKYYRTSPQISTTTTAAFQVTVKVLSANRPDLNTAGEIGFLDAKKTIRIGLTPSRVGFVDNPGKVFTHSVAIDTTNAFHTYRVIKYGNSTIELYINNMDSPVLQFPYSELANLSSTAISKWPNGVAFLWQGSNAGRSEAQLLEFAYNVGGTDIPEPATCLLLTLGGLAIVRLKKN